MPVAASASYTATSKDQGNIVGILDCLDTGVQSYPGILRLASASTITPLVHNAGSTYLVDAVLTATAPFTFGNGDQIFASGTYEAA